jgi:hypothetical protein
MTELKKESSVNFNLAVIFFLFCLMAGVIFFLQFALGWTNRKVYGKAVIRPLA